MKKVSPFLLVMFLVVGVSVSANAGLLGTYYNLSSAHPDMETTITGLITGMVESTLTGPTPTLTAAGSSYVNQFDWWNAAYQVGQRTDSDADLQTNFSSSWFPAIVNTGLTGDPQHFAVHWTGQFYVDTDKTYTYSMGSDDDSWLFIDDLLILDLGGIHAVTYTSYTVSLTQGWHDIDIFFAERHEVQSGFQLNFFSDLVPTPVPEPATMFLVGSGILGLAGLRRKFGKR